MVHLSDSCRLLPQDHPLILTRYRGAVSVSTAISLEEGVSKMDRVLKHGEEVKMTRILGPQIRFSAMTQIGTQIELETEFPDTLLEALRLKTDTCFKSLKFSHFGPESRPLELDSSLRISQFPMDFRFSVITIEKMEVFGR